MIGITVGIVSLTIFWVTSRLNRTISSSSHEKTGTNRSRNRKSSNIITASFYKEFRLITRDTRFLSQFIFLFIIIQSFAFIFKFEHHEPILYLSIFAINLFAITIGMAMVPIERKSLYLLKIAPISSQKLLFNKSLFAASIAFIAGVLTGIIFILLKMVSFSTFLFYVVSCIPGTLVAAISGILVGVYFGDLNWENPNRLVSLSGYIISMILNGLISAIIVLNLYLFFHVPKYTLTIGFISLTLFTFILWRGTRWSKRGFDKLDLSI